MWSVAAGAWFSTFFKKKAFSRRTQRACVPAWCVLALRISGRYLVRVRIAFALDTVDIDAFGGVVTARCGSGRAIHFDEVGIIDVIAEPAFDHFEIVAVAIANQLNAVGETRHQNAHNSHRIIEAATSRQIHDHFAFSIDSDSRTVEGVGKDLKSDLIKMYPKNFSCFFHGNTGHLF